MPRKPTPSVTARVDAPAFWLMKTEPDVFSLATLQAKGVAPWDGVRNYQARNHIRAMAVGDVVFIYHSNAEPSGVAGVATVARAAYPDHTAWDPRADYFDAKSTPENPRWSMVDVAYHATFARFLPLPALRTLPELAGMTLLDRPRLSVQPVRPEHAAILFTLGRPDHPAPRSRT